MFIERIKTPGIAHNAYLLGTEGIGILVDPRRDIDEYLQASREKGVSIKYVLETHRQEDFVLGASSLRDLFQVKLVGGKHEIFNHVDLKLRDGEELAIGDIVIRALHTPGHTPESMSYAVFRKAHRDKCWGVFTGDALFVGDTGRTDLTDENKTAENAGILFDSVHKKIAPLGDQTLIFPAHGAGSVCGGNIEDYDQSTIGFERTYNPVFKLSREEFMTAKAKERMPRPPYFRNMEKLNLQGGLALKKKADLIPELQPKEFESLIKKGIVIDARSPEAYAGGHIPGSYNIWLEGLPVFGGWTAKPDTPCFLVLESESDLETAFMHLARIGIDEIAGVLSEGFEGWRDAGLPVETSGTITPRELKEEDSISVIDVREISEYEDEGHIPNSYHLYVGHINQTLSERGSLPFKKDQPIAVTCSVGHRAGLAASVLRQHGYQKVYNLLGGMTAWSALNYPKKKAEDRDHQLEDGRSQQRESARL